MVMARMRNNKTLVVLRRGVRALNLDAYIPCDAFFAKRQLQKTA